MFSKSAHCFKNIDSCRQAPTKGSTPHHFTFSATLKCPFRHFSNCTLLREESMESFAIDKIYVHLCLGEEKT